MRSLSALLLAAALGAPAAAGELETQAGTPIVEPPTLIALGFEWPIKGDENRNATATLAYRKVGEAEWREGLPLLRIGGEEIRNGASFNIVTPHMFAGSVFDLEPATAYEVRLRLSDPDGVQGQTEHVIQARTRAEPRPAEGGNVYHVYPRDFKGTKQEPAFTSLLAAYNTGANGADWVNSFVPRVKPGDTILVHAGTYRDNRRAYGGGNSTLFDGTMYLTADGTADRPIVIKAAGDGEVVFDGAGNSVLFDLMAADYNYFEGITVRNTETAFLLGRKRIGGSVGFSLKRSRIENVGRGVFTDYGGARDFYIADNVFIGRNDPKRLMGWTGRVWRGMDGFPQLLLTEYAVKVYGSGHVIAYNHVANFHDGIDHATYGDPDEWPNTPRDRLPVALDIYNNDIVNVDDNCIEADAVMHNARILRNRCFSNGHRALSTQPALGGPIYFIRNIVYHAPEGGALKLTANSAGVLVYNNTFLSEVLAMGPVSNIHLRNNLILGQGASPGGPGDPITASSPWPETLAIESYTPYSSSDYNGFGRDPATLPRSAGRRRQLAPSTRLIVRSEVSPRSPNLPKLRDKIGGALQSTGTSSSRPLPLHGTSPRASGAPTKWTFVYGPDHQRSTKARCCPGSRTASSAGHQIWARWSLADRSRHMGRDRPRTSGSLSMLVRLKVHRPLTTRSSRSPPNARAAGFGLYELPVKDAIKGRVAVVRKNNAYNPAVC